MHSDRGSQYTYWVFGERLRSAGLLKSMGQVASTVDNTMMESFWSTMQRELLDTRAWPDREHLADLTPTIRRVSVESAGGWARAATCWSTRWSSRLP